MDESPKYINIHTHHPTYHGDCIEVLSIDARVKKIEKPKSFFCFGIHPWYSKSVSFDDFQANLTNLSKDSHFFGLGEIGLDKSCSIDFNHQLSLFRKQIILAKKLNIKLIVLHIVKAHNECIAELKSLNYAETILIHDYRSNSQIFEQYQRNFKTYISLGKTFLLTKKAKELVLNVPIKSIFLETDDQQDTSIKKIYTFLQVLLKMETQELVRIMSINWNNLQRN